MKASGISLYRILMPIYIFSLCMGFVVMTFTEYVVPRANLCRDDILSQGNEFKFTFSRNREMDRNRIFLSNDDGKIIYARSYITRNKTAQGVFIIEPLNRSTKIGIKSRIDARYMTFSNGMWELQSVGTDSVVVRTFTKEGEVHTVSLECAEARCENRIAKRVSDEVQTEEEKTKESEDKKDEDGGEDKDKDKVNFKDKLASINPFTKDKKAADNS